MALTTVSFSIGAAFLLATLLMLGTWTGFIPSSFQAGKLFPILAGVLLVAVAGYSLAPNFRSRWRWVMANATSILPPHLAPAPAPVSASTEHCVRVQSKPSAMRQPHADLKGVVITRGPADLVGEITPDAAGQVLPAPPQKADWTPAPAAAAAQAVVSHEDSHHENRVKRAFQHVGHFLHISKAQEHEP